MQSFHRMERWYRLNPIIITPLRTVSLFIQIKYSFVLWGFPIFPLTLFYSSQKYPN